MNGRTELSKWIIEQCLVPADITDKVSSLICTHIVYICTINVTKAWKFIHMGAFGIFWPNKHFSSVCLRNVASICSAS